MMSREAVERQADVEATVVAMVLGCRVWPAELEGQRCVGDHGAVRFPLGEGVGCHWEQCAVLTKIPRHDAVRDQLATELMAVGDVEKEVTPAWDGKMLRVGRRKDVKVPGDVVVTMDGGGRRVWLDVAVSSVAGVVASKHSQGAAERAYAEKWKAWRSQPWGGSAMEFVPVALSTSSVVAAGSRKALLPLIGAAGVDRLVVVMMMHQAVVLRRMRRAVEERKATLGAASGAVRRADGRWVNPGDGRVAAAVGGRGDNAVVNVDSSASDGDGAGNGGGSDSDSSGSGSGGGGSGGSSDGDAAAGGGGGGVGRRGGARGRGVRGGR